MLKALSIQQPWAWAILHAGKRIENRTWNASHRGRLLIHAPNRYDRAGEWRLLETLRSLNLYWPQRAKLRAQPRGAIVGLCEVTDWVWYDDVLCHAGDQEPWACGPYCAVLADVRVFETPCACKGRLRLWSPPNDVLAALWGSRLLHPSFRPKATVDPRP